MMGVHSPHGSSTWRQKNKQTGKDYDFDFNVS